MASDNRFKRGIQKAIDNTSENVESNVIYNAVDNMKENTSSNTINSILDDVLKSSKKDRGKNHTIYLSAEVGNALDSQVKQSGMSKSELVDKILRKVLPS